MDLDYLNHRYIVPLTPDTTITTPEEMKIRYGLSSCKLVIPTDKYFGGRYWICKRSKSKNGPFKTTYVCYDCPQRKAIHQWKTGDKTFGECRVLADILV